MTRVGAENVIAEYCMRGLNATIPPSQTGADQAVSAGPSGQVDEERATIITASRNTAR